MKLDLKELLSKLLIKRKTVRVTNLQNYSGGSYYKEVPISVLGVPRDNIVSINIDGWAGLGTNPNLGIATNVFYVFYTSGTTISSSSYITVGITYVGGVVRRLINTLKTLASERRWVTC